MTQEPVPPSSSFPLLPYPALHFSWTLHRWKPEAWPVLTLTYTIGQCSCGALTVLQALSWPLSYVRTTLQSYHQPWGWKKCSLTGAEGNQRPSKLLVMLKLTWARSLHLGWERQTPPGEAERRRRYKSGLWKEMLNTLTKLLSSTDCWKKEDKKRKEKRKKMWSIIKNWLSYSHSDRL